MKDWLLVRLNDKDGAQAIMNLLQNHYPSMQLYVTEKSYRLMTYFEVRIKFTGLISAEQFISMGVEIGKTL